MKARIKLYSDSGAKVRDFEFTFPAGTSEQHAHNVFDSLTTLARFHPGEGKTIFRSGEEPMRITHQPHCATLFRGPFPGPCNCIPIVRAIDWASGKDKTVIMEHHTPTGHAPGVKQC